MGSMACCDSCLTAAVTRGIKTNMTLQEQQAHGKYAHAGSRTRVTSMGGLYDAATLHALYRATSTYLEIVADCSRLQFVDTLRTVLPHAERCDNNTPCAQMAKPNSKESQKASRRPCPERKTFKVAHVFGQPHFKLPFDSHVISATS